MVLFCLGGCERLTELLDCLLSDRALNVQIMLSHIDVCMANDALDRWKIDSKSLHLRDISMSAAVRRQDSNLWDCLKSFFELVSKVGRVAGLVSNLHFPNGIQEVSGSILLHI